MLSLPAVTLLCVDTRSPLVALWAIRRCLERASFGKVVLLTDLDRFAATVPSSQRMSGVVEVVAAPPIHNTADYSQLMLGGLVEHLLGTHLLVVQWDGLVLDPSRWDPAFLEYDYIGAPWPHIPSHPVGNGGFSLRSRRLLEALSDATLPRTHPEDVCICVENRARLEQEYHVRFAPVDVARRFANERLPWAPAFGFHGFFNFAAALSPSELSEFLSLVPAAYCAGDDAFDLITQLRRRGQWSQSYRLLAKVPYRKPLHHRFWRAWLGS